MMLTALWVVLASAPLDIRVLERERPTAFELSAAAVTCDGAPLSGTSFPVSVDGGKLLVGKAVCVAASATGASVKLPSLTRTFPGSVELTLEKNVVRLINHVDVDDYLPSVLAAEADGLKPATLAAQAVVSRTFALAGKDRHAKAGYHLCDLAHCQVYRGVEGETPAARAAVTETKGLVLLRGGVKLEPVFFHAACGGGTSSAADVFGETSSAPGVSDLDRNQALCSTSPDFAWSFTVDRAKLAEAIGAQNSGEPFEVLRRDPSGRVVALKSFGIRLSGNDFLARVGRALGWKAMRSMKVRAKEADGVLEFSGTGTGHGVGMCQWGAEALAKQGKTFRDVLSLYFPQHVLSAWPNPVRSP